MRHVLLPLALALCCSPALAQDGEPSSPDPAPASRPTATSLRLSLSSTAKVDGSTVEPNVMQAFLFTELHQIGVRVDSERKTGHPAYDKWIQAQVDRWAEKEPDAPPASLSIVATQTAEYNGAKFYGETQAHIFKGELRAEIKAADGQSLAQIAYKFEWGKAIRTKRPDGSVEVRTKPDVMKQYDELVQKALVCGLLANDALRSRLTPAQLAKADAQLKKYREYLLGILDKSTEATREGELATFLRSLPGS